MSEELEKRVHKLEKRVHMLEELARKIGGAIDRRVERMKESQAKYQERQAKYQERMEELSRIHQEKMKELEEVRDIDWEELICGDSIKSRIESTMGSITDLLKKLKDDEPTEDENVLGIFGSATRGELFRVGTAVEITKPGDVNFGLAGTIKSIFHQDDDEKWMAMVDFHREGEPAVPYWLEHLKLGDTGEVRDED